MLKIGDKVNDFSCKDDSGKIINFSEYKGKKVVVFFYPKADTPGCTAEACSLRDNYKEISDLGYSILGVSADTEKKQKSFSDKFQLNFPLIADSEKEIINLFGVWGPKKFMGREYKGILRTTFIIDGNSVIKKVIDKVKTKEHAEQVLEILKTL
tara:strand:+ start:23 stop:484 length:462 start_codon:yes stop_codon:yes gene_type:complete